MIQEDLTCDKVCEGCDYENTADKCLATILITVKAKVAIIETMEPGDTINTN